jgi:NAD(P)-dependent dehydrogenase (short-subunit alcohol dehydrogenase family)
MAKQSVEQGSLVAVVTGANRGMGLETCRQLAAKGYRVALCARKAKAAKDAAAELAEGGAQVMPFVLDVTDATSVKAGAAALRKAFGRVDVLVNNAGIVPDIEKDGRASVFDAKPEILLKGFQTNTLGAFLMCRALVPGMVERNFGRVVNVSTGMAALNGMNGGWPAYRISKTALNALTAIVADEVKGKNVKVNSVCPGWVKTDMGGAGASRSVPDGAAGIVWAATLPDDGPSGGFYRDGKQIDW